MMLLLHLRFVFVSLVATVVASTQNASFDHSSADDTTTTVRNANHIFNAIHSSMRQWGSSWFHNGMSFFLATVPADIQLFHGTHTPARVKTMEWLAFEPEHAIQFAHSWNPNPLPHHGGPPPGKGPSARSGQSPPSQRIHLQQILAQGIAPGDPDEIQGYFHIYKTKHELKLLYVDGMSAGKTSMGTIDSQDYILTNGTDREWFNDPARARDMCSMANDLWDQRIDGIIRMEAGFEIILCNFDKHLDFIRIQKQPGWNASDNMYEAFQQFRYFRAIADRYHGIGGDRARIDYDNFVSIFAYDIDLFRNGPMPRLLDASPSQRRAVFDEIHQMILHPQPSSGINWQSVADMYITRYATVLLYLLEPSLTANPRRFRDELSALMRPFLDFEATQHGVTKETAQQCAEVFIPSCWNTSLAGRAIHSVAMRICTTLTDTLRATYTPTSHTVALANIQGLVTWLDWSVWRECPTCAVDQVCVLPIWPMGAREDREHPRCKNETSIMPHDRTESYWFDVTEALPPGIPLDPHPSDQPSP